MDRVYPDIGARLRDLRKARKRSLTSLAEMSGYSTGYLSRLEHGSRDNPTIAFVWDIAKALDVTPADVLGLSPEDA